MNTHTIQVARTLASVVEPLATVPVIGKPLELAGALAGLGLALPQFLWSRPRSTKPTKGRADLLTAAALSDIVPSDRLHTGKWPHRNNSLPLWRGTRKRYLHETVYYNDYGQKMDIWRRRDLVGPAPVLLFIPGGAWMVGRRTPQGYALMSHLAERGWICLAIDYRVSPKHAWPSQLDDVKTAIAWAHANVARFGGDPDFLAVAGASAGGHLASLAGLTHDDPAYPGDTSVDAVVSLYGKYDWHDRSTPYREMFIEFIDRIIVKRRFTEDPHVFHNASPIAKVRSDAPPFLIVHGTSDLLIPAEEAQRFADTLALWSAAPVSYLELPGAHHAFDLFDRARTPAVVTGIELFLDEMYQLKQLPALIADKGVANGTRTAVGSGV